MSRSTRLSIASSLCALSLVAAGCGESTSHRGPDVERAFADAGLRLQGAPLADWTRYTPLGRRTRSYALAHYTATLAERHVEPWLLTGERELVVAVYRDAFDADRDYRAIPRDVFRRQGLVVLHRDNVIVAADERDSALARDALARL